MYVLHVPSQPSTLKDMRSIEKNKYIVMSKHDIGRRDFLKGLGAGAAATALALAGCKKTNDAPADANPQQVWAR